MKYAISFDCEKMTFFGQLQKRVSFPMHIIKVFAFKEESQSKMYICLTEHTPRMVRREWFLECANGVLTHSGQKVFS